MLLLLLHFGAKQVGKKSQEKQAYIVTATTLLAITLMYWWAADPPNPWIFGVTGCGALLCIAIIVIRRRAGHYG